METALDRVYRGLRFLTDYVVGYVAALVMLGGTLLALVEIFRRYVLGVVWNWGQDAVTYFIIGSIFLFFSVTQARRSHLAVTAGLDWLKARGHLRCLALLRAVNSVLALCFFSAFAWWGYPAVARMFETSRKTQSMELLLWPFQACLLAGFAIMALLAVFQLYQDLQALRGRKVFTWAETEEGLEI